MVRAKFSKLHLFEVGAWIANKYIYWLLTVVTAVAGDDDGEWVCYRTPSTEFIYNIRVCADRNPPQPLNSTIWYICHAHTHTYTHSQPNFKYIENNSHSADTTTTTTIDSLYPHSWNHWFWSEYLNFSTFSTATDRRFSKDCNLCVVFSLHDFMTTRYMIYMLRTIYIFLVLSSVDLIFFCCDLVFPVYVFYNYGKEICYDTLTHHTHSYLSHQSLAPLFWANFFTFFFLLCFFSS